MPLRCFACCRLFSTLSFTPVTPLRHAAIIATIWHYVAARGLRYVAALYAMLLLPLCAAIRHFRVATRRFFDSYYAGYGRRQRYA